MSPNGLHHSPVFQHCMPVPEALFKDADYFSAFHPYVHKSALEPETKDPIEVSEILDSADEKAPLGSLCALLFPDTPDHRLLGLSCMSDLLLEHDSGIKIGKGSGSSLNYPELRAEACVRVMDANRNLGKPLVEALDQWLQTKLPQLSSFITLDQYIGFRVPEPRISLSIQQICFSGTINLTKEQKSLILPLLQYGLAHITLTDDYFSFNRDLSLSPSPINAVAVLAEIYGLDFKAAKVVLHEKISKQERNYRQLKEDLVKHSFPENGVRRFLDLLEVMMAGNMLWGALCERYQVIEKEGVGDNLPGKKGENEEIRDEMSETFARIRKQSSDTNPGEVYVLLTPTTSVSVNYSHLAMEDKDNFTIPEEIVLAPYNYTSSLKGKGVWKGMIDGLQTWYNVPDSTLEDIQKVVQDIHNHTLMLADIEDYSEIRGNQPAAHTIYCSCQTINSANLALVQAMQVAQQLPEGGLAIVLDELSTMHLGQGWDLHCTWRNRVPTEEEYLAICDSKTGALFRMIARLMNSAATTNKKLSTQSLMKWFGRYYHILNDYRYFVPEDPTTQPPPIPTHPLNFSLPLLHALHTSPPHPILIDILQMNRGDVLRKETWELVLRILEEAGSLEYVKNTLRCLISTVKESVQEAEREGGKEGWGVRELVWRVDGGDF